MHLRIDRHRRAGGPGHQLVGAPSRTLSPSTAMRHDGARVREAPVMQRSSQHRPGRRPSGIHRCQPDRQSRVPGRCDRILLDPCDDDAGVSLNCVGGR